MASRHISRRILDCRCPVEWAHPLNRGLVSEWAAAPLSGWRGASTMRDLSRGGKVANDGTLIGAAAWQGNSRPSGYGAIQFSTANNTNRVENTAGVGLPTGASAAWTLAFWHKTASNVSLSQYFGFGPQLPGSAGTGNARQILNFNSHYYFWGHNFDWDTGVAFNNDNKWHFVVFTTPGGSTTPTITLYVDGVSKASGSPGGALVTAPTFITMGSSHGSAVSSPNAAIDGGMIFARNFSANEVATLTAETSQGNPNRWRWLGRTAYSFAAAPASTYVSGWEAVYPSRYDDRLIPVPI